MGEVVPQPPHGSTAARSGGQLMSERGRGWGAQDAPTSMSLALALAWGTFHLRGEGLHCAKQCPHTLPRARLNGGSRTARRSSMETPRRCPANQLAVVETTHAAAPCRQLRGRAVVACRRGRRAHTLSLAPIHPPMPMPHLMPMPVLGAAGLAAGLAAW